MYMVDKKAKATSKIANRLSTIKKYFSRQGDLSDLSDLSDLNDIASFALFATSLRSPMSSIAAGAA
jgi:hypothetical protein